MENSGSRQSAVGNRFPFLSVGPARFGGFFVGAPAGGGDVYGAAFAGSLDECLAFVRSQFETSAFETWKEPGEGVQVAAPAPARRSRRRPTAEARLPTAP